MFVYSTMTFPNWKEVDFMEQVKTHPSTDHPPHHYIAIDLKSFYASVECIERGLDPLQNHLVVADASRTDKTICLAVSPSLKAHGIPGRPRLFEVVQKVREINAGRRIFAPKYHFNGSSFYEPDLVKDPALELSYITATPRMSLYLKYSTDIYRIYLRYISPEDILVYSIDEVFIDATPYLKTYSMDAHTLAMTMIREVLTETGITATAGIGTNLYLCKVAMDITAKHMPADKDGVRIAELDELSYRKLLWHHTPLTDFWRVGKGYAKKLAEYGMYTMGDVARCSIGKQTDFYNEDLLYRLFGVNAELLIDHAWGWEPCTIELAKNYTPEAKSLSEGQVLSRPYRNDEAKIIVKEMADTLILKLVEKDLVTGQLTLHIGYDVENLQNPMLRQQYHGEVKTDRYGRSVPKHAHGTTNLRFPCSSTKLIIHAVSELFDRITDPGLLIRRITLSAEDIISRKQSEKQEHFEQLSLFDEQKEDSEFPEKFLEQEESLQKAVLKLHQKYGKNALFKGIDLLDGATALERNRQVGGHKA